MLKGASPNLNFPIHFALHGPTFLAHLYTTIGCFAKMKETQDEVSPLSNKKHELKPGLVLTDSEASRRWSGRRFCLELEEVFRSMCGDLPPCRLGVGGSLWDIFSTFCKAKLATLFNLVTLFPYSFISHGRFSCLNEGNFPYFREEISRHYFITSHCGKTPARNL